MLLVLAGVTLSASTVWALRWRIERLRRRADASGEQLAVLARDLPERAAAEQALRSSEDRFRTVLNTAQNGIVVVGHDGGLILHNRALADLLGYPADELAQLSVGQLVPAAALEQITALLTARMWSDAAPTRHEVQMVRRDGEVLDIDMSVEAFRQDHETVGVLVEVRDLTESKRASEAIRRMADYDALTGLPNRSLFGRYAEQAVTDAERAGRAAAVLVIDLDRFKLVNDALGHPGGDRLLKAVAKRVSAHLSPRHTLARYGGDEFLVLVPDLSGRDDAVTAARAVIDAFTADFEHEGQDVRLSASVGVSVYPHHGDSADSLIQHASVALTEAKALGGGRYALYQPAGKGAGRDRLTLEADLSHALERGEFVLNFQPEVDVVSGEIVAVEALIRWDHPERGRLMPGDFVPLLEETGLIVPVGEWVLRAACEQAKAWERQGLPALRVTVNLSARQFLEADLATTVRGVLEETELPPARLEVEVTETTAMQNPETAIAVLTEIRQMGVRASLDDFGIGHSSLGRLKQFPVDTLKIDRSFVSSADESADDEAIVRGIIALAHALGLSVVEEGVETETQLALLRNLECDLVQGFLYSPPVAADALAVLLTEGAQIDLAA